MINTDSQFIKFMKYRGKTIKMYKGTSSIGFEANMKVLKDLHTHQAPHFGSHDCLPTEKTGQNVWP